MVFDYAVELVTYWVGGFFMRFGPFAFAILLSIVSGMIVMYSGTSSFKDSLGIPPLILVSCKLFSGWVLSVFIIVWVLFWAEFRNLVSIFDMILSIFDMNLGRHIDDNPRISSFMKASGVTQLLYSYHDYTPKEKEIRYAQEGHHRR